MSTHPSMTTLANEYLDYRRKLGFGLHTAGQLLLHFAKYADETGHRGAVTAELAIRWAGQAESASGSHRAYRLTVVRGFARHRALFDPATEVPPHDVFGPRYLRRPPYIFSPAELTALLQAAAQLPPEGSLRPHTFSTFFGLLACTGLRHSEARRLTGADVDFNRRLLNIRESKFRKSRLVPLHESAADTLQAYAHLRDQHFPVARTDAFFISLRGMALGTSTVQGAFRLVRQKLTWRTGDHGFQPRLHDLRHTFACHRLIDWYQQGVDVQHGIAALATYLGHADVNHTYWYLTGTPELLELAGSRFEHFTTPGTAS